jgi:nitronate monooxygenase
MVAGLPQRSRSALRVFLWARAFMQPLESLGHQNARARILASSGEDTVRTSVFDTVRGYQWPCGVTGRALRNDFAERWHGHERELTAAVDAEHMRYQAAVASGDVDSAVVFAGEGADLIEDVPQASEVVTRMVAEAERSLVAAGSQIT